MKQTREDFIRATVANTLSDYLKRFCSPYTIEQVQRKCIEDAEKLADKLYGTIEMKVSELNSVSPRKRLTK